MPKFPDIILTDSEDEDEDATRIDEQSEHRIMRHGSQVGTSISKFVCLIIFAQNVISINKNCLDYATGSRKTPKRPRDSNQESQHNEFVQIVKNGNFSN